MSEFHRMITYLYLYEHGTKRHNVGFAKIEKRGGQCLVEIHMKNTGHTSSLAPVYFYATSRGKHPGILLGTMGLPRGSGDFKTILKGETLADSNYSLDDIRGIFIPLSDEVMFVSQWDDSEFIRKNFVEPESVSEKPDSQSDESGAETGDSGQANGAEASSKAQGSRTGASLPKQANGTAIPSQTQGNRAHAASQTQANRAQAASQTQTGRAAVPSQTQASRAKAASQMQANRARTASLTQASRAVISSQIQANRADISSQTQNNRADVSSKTLNNRADVSSQTQNNRAEFSSQTQTGSAETPSPEQTKKTGIPSQTQANSMEISSQTPNGSTEASSQEQADSAEIPPSEQSEGTKASSQSNPTVSASPDLRAAEALPNFRENFQHRNGIPLPSIPKPEPLPENWNLKWEFIMENYPVMTPFAGDEKTLCVRWELKDLRLLPRQYWYLGNNSFLLHGFFNYRYLILGITEKAEKKRWFIGIPGVYQNPERVMATLFGFPEFRNEKSAPVNTGEFGYWYRYLNE